MDRNFQAELETQFREMIEATLRQLGRELRVGVAELSQYAAARTEHLSTLVGEPGFEEAVLAERDNVLLRAGITATRTADVADQRFVGIIQGALRIGAAALAV